MQRLLFLALLALCAGCGPDTSTSVAPPLTEEEARQQDEAGAEYSEEYGKQMNEAMRNR